MRKKILIGIIILLISGGTVFGYRHVKQSQKDKSLIQVSTSAKVRGPDVAPIRILDFSDFQCPACRAAAPILESLMEKYPGKIQLVFKHFPLRMHVFSPVAHQSAECAAEQGKFWEFYRKIYENQPTWSVLPDPMAAFVSYAKDIGVDINQFAQCMTNPVVAEHIMAEKKEGEVLEVKSTPTFFINGKMFAGPLELQNGGEAMIRNLLGLPALPPVASPSAQPQTQATEPNKKV